MHSIQFPKTGVIKIDQTKKLGKGAYGSVYLVKDKSNKKYALKIIDYTNETKDILLDEIKILQTIKNKDTCIPGIICIYDHIIDSKNKKLYILTEYIDGQNIFKLSENISYFSKSVFKQLFEQGIQYLTYIHKKGFIHRDIKPENMMMTKSKQLKIIDFGLSCDKYKCTDYAGTPNFMSPIYNNCEISDVFSFGMSLFDIYYSNMFIYKDLKDIAELVCAHERGKILIDAICAELGIEQIYSELWKNMIEPTGLLKFSARELYSILKQKLSIEQIKQVIPKDFEQCHPITNDTSQDWNILLEQYKIEN